MMKNTSFHQIEEKTGKFLENERLQSRSQRESWDLGKMNDKDFLMLKSIKSLKFRRLENFDSHTFYESHKEFIGSKS